MELIYPDALYDSSEWEEGKYYRELLSHIVKIDPEASFPITHQSFVASISSPASLTRHNQILSDCNPDLSLSIKLIVLLKEQIHKMRLNLFVSVATLCILLTFGCGDSAKIITHINKIDRHGNLKITFVNEGAKRGSICGKIHIDRFPNSKDHDLSSEIVCSGDIRPSSESTVVVKIQGVWQLCGSSGLCYYDWETTYYKTN